VGVKNIYHFGEELATKRIWRDLFFLGISTEVLKVKYYKNKSIDD